ncbi:hypothetical protein J7M23_06350 [Candidatus Sumerlaeota bacterium]|nr:hypothetical protein [Candidatus Sumerlaeota bacterium]
MTTFPYTPPIRSLESPGKELWQSWRASILWQRILPTSLLNNRLIHRLYFCNRVN